MKFWLCYIAVPLHVCVENIALCMQPGWHVYKRLLLIGFITNLWGPFRGDTYVPSLNFKTFLFTYWGESHVPVHILLLYLRLSSLLLQFQSTFVSFVAISSVLCPCFKAMSLVGIYPNRASPIWYSVIQQLCTVFAISICITLHVRFLCQHNNGQVIRYEWNGIWISTGASIRLFTGAISIGTRQHKQVQYL